MYYQEGKVSCCWYNKNNDDDNDYSQGYGQIKEVFRVLTKDDILQPYISDHDLSSSSITSDDVSLELNVFDIRFQQNFTASPPIKVEKISMELYLTISTDMLWC